MARWPGIAAGYVGAVVGAGFASGKEIEHFFVRHGRWGLAGAGLAGVLFGWVGAAILSRIGRSGHRHYGALLRDLCGPSLGAALDHIGTLSLLVGLAAVTAGAGALGRLVFGWPTLVGLVLFALALAGALAGGRRAHLIANVVVVPVIAVVCVVAALTAGSGRVPPAPLRTHFPWILAAVLYVAYNLLVGAAGLCAATDGSESPRDLVCGGWWGGAALGVVCGAATLAMLHAGRATWLEDLPLAGTLPAGPWRGAAYPLALLAALWTTGSAAAMALGGRLAPRRPTAPAVLAALLAAPLALLGLSRIVTFAYPVLGYAGIPLLGGAAVAGARDLFIRRRP